MSAYLDHGVCACAMPLHTVIGTAKKGREDHYFTNQNCHIIMTAQSMLRHGISLSLE